ncbi:hypothetical protein AVEN_128412-1 [Araneus ventricosus]|uniref:Uncharacterized protein n=1 Tax=Araneus ventricosus TaxID=182803 RepID=A0A4Y2UGR9_ARAVE|nr:hypothetical protein AVEN_128412-1 [Araneus ventricosus]
MISGATSRHRLIGYIYYNAQSHIWQQKFACAVATSENGLQLVARGATDRHRLIGYNARRLADAISYATGCLRLIAALVANTASKVLQYRRK